MKELNNGLTNSMPRRAVSEVEKLKEEQRIRDKTLRRIMSVGFGKKRR